MEVRGERRGGDQLKGTWTTFLQIIASIVLLVMVTSCLLGPCLSAAPCEPGVGPLTPPKGGSGLCQGG